MSNRIEQLTGTIITTKTGTTYKLTKVAGSGTQGVIYNEVSGKKMIKIYYPTGNREMDEEILSRLTFIQKVKMPRNFVKVEEILEEPYIGYVMEKVEGYQSLNSYLIPPKKETFANWYNKGLGLRERMFIGYIIAKAFSELEEDNLSYCDISGTNILVHTTKNGASVKMIDVDNIYIAGRGLASVLGTPRYIAPEVIKKQKNPDVLSDNYALAVILFELLRVGHPYLGDDVLAGTPEEEEQALSGNGIYVTEENSLSMLPEYLVFTDKLKELFRKCFEEGKQNRLARPSAKEFEYALLEASNKLIQCSVCGAWHYPRKQGRIYEPCPWCDAESKPKARLNFYDCLFYGASYQQKTLEETMASKKIVNSYMLREGKNQIKRLYIMKQDNLNKNYRASENYLTIAKDEKGYHAYNEFSQEGIVIFQFVTSNYIRLEPKEEILLKNGDAIFFELEQKDAFHMECGGKLYSYIRMARFMEG